MAPNGKIMNNIKTNSLLVILLSFIATAQAGMELYYDFELKENKFSSVPDRTDNNFYGSPRSSRLYKLAPVIKADTPKKIAFRSKKSLDNKGGFIWIRNGGKLDLSKDMTLNFWFKASSWDNNYCAFITRIKSWRLLYAPKRKLLLFQGKQYKTSTKFKIDLNKLKDWTMLSLVKKGNILTVYINGRKIKQGKCSAQLDSSGTFYIGTASTQGSYAYNGLIDDLAIWNTAFSPMLISSLYKGKSPLTIGTDKQLKRIITKKFSSDFKAYTPKRKFSFAVSNAVIVASEKGRFSGVAKKLQEQLESKWGIQFPIIKSTKAKSTSKNLIIFGNSNSNMLTRELNANFLLGNNAKGYEVRTIPDALDWKKNVLFFGGKNKKEIMQGVNSFLEINKQAHNVKYYIDCQGWNSSDLPDPVKIVEDLKQFYRKDDSNKNDIAIKKYLRESAELYKMTGQDKYAKAFAQMIKIFDDNYDKSLNNRKTPPSFVFHHFSQFVDVVEESPAFTAKDSVRSAEIIRKIVEQILNYWEMRKPLKLYSLNKKKYLTNHSCFASRSVAVSARYLLSHYNYIPAKFWKAVADNAFQGAAKNPFSPEDAAGYQYLVYRIFVDYALGSGKYELKFFKDKNFKSYVNFAKNQFNHLGYTAGFGDCYPTGARSAYLLLKQAVDILGDAEAEYLLSLIERECGGGFFKDKISKWDIRHKLPPPGRNTYGLNVVPVISFKQKYYEVYKLFKRQTLDKAMIRSDWSKYADFMSVTGINGGPHGHFDANSISQYIYANRLWLFEGDYIRKFPYNHNSIVISRNAQTVDQRRNMKKRTKNRLSQILCAIQSKDKKSALLSLVLEDYSDMNWERNIAWEAQNGFWVVDQLTALKPGNYTTECFWRTTGKLKTFKQTVEVIQKKSDDSKIPWHFFITEGNGANRFIFSEFERTHGRKDGNLTGYAFSAKKTRNIVQQFKRNLKQGEKLLYVNFMKATKGNSPEAIEVLKINNNVFITNSKEFPRMAIIGKFSSKELFVDAEICFIGSKGIVARGLKKLRINNSTYTTSAKATAIAINKLSGNTKKTELKSILMNIVKRGQIVHSAQPASIKTVVSETNYTMTSKSYISASAAFQNKIATGTQDGTFELISNEGEIIFSKKFSAGISAICPVLNNKELFWVVGTETEDSKKASSPIRLLDENGNVLWKKEIGLYHRRYGTARTIFTANLDGDRTPEIIVGVDAWHYYAFSLSGKQLWRQMIYHGATVGASGDMNGDGKDDIAAGNEYYVHSLIAAGGKIISKKTSSPWDVSVAVCDLNGDGIKEAVFGRSDSYLHVFAPSGNSMKQWVCNVGGKPEGIAVLPNGNKAKIAVATFIGDVVFVNAKGKKTKYINLPGPLTDIKYFKNELFVSCLDGFVYKLDLAGNIQSKIPYSVDTHSTFLPKLNITEKTVSLTSGKNIYIINL